MAQSWVLSTYRHARLSKCNVIPRLYIGIFVGFATVNVPMPMLDNSMQKLTCLQMWLLTDPNVQPYSQWPFKPRLALEVHRTCRKPCISATLSLLCCSWRITFDSIDVAQPNKISQHSTHMPPREVRQSDLQATSQPGILSDDYNK